jgi:hypothetical protein
MVHFWSHVYHSHKILSTTLFTDVCRQISNTIQMLTVYCYFTRSHQPLLDRTMASSNEHPQSVTSWVTYSDVAVAAPSLLPRRLSDKRPISYLTPTDSRTPSSTSTNIPLAQPFSKPTALHRDMFLAICLIRSTWISGILSSYYAEICEIGR